MIHLLAQSTAPITHDSIGLFVVIAMMLSKWLWDYNRSKREESGQHEPKANPALHRQFVTRTEFDRHVTDMGSRLDKIEKAGEDRVIRIYDKIDDQTDRIIDAVLNKPTHPRR